MVKCIVLKIVIKNLASRSKLKKKNIIISPPVLGPLVSDQEISGHRHHYVGFHMPSKRGHGQWADGQENGKTR